MPPALVLIPDVPSKGTPQASCTIGVVMAYIAEFGRINSLKPCWFIINGRMVLL
jgi:hypothetical protein